MRAWLRPSHSAWAENIANAWLPIQTYGITSKGRNFHRENGYQIRRRIYAVLATEMGQSRKTARTYAASVKISVQYRQSTSFFLFHTVADTVLWDRTVVLTIFNPVFVTFTEYEGHHLQTLV